MNAFTWTLAIVVLIPVLIAATAAFLIVGLIGLAIVGVALAAKAIEALLDG